MNPVPRGKSETVQFCNHPFSGGPEGRVVWRVQRTNSALRAAAKKEQAILHNLPETGSGDTLGKFQAGNDRGGRRSLEPEMDSANSSDGAMPA
jgi:hypothetical protein